MVKKDDVWHVRLSKSLCYWRNWRGRCRNTKHKDFNFVMLPKCSYEDCPEKIAKK